MGSGTAPRRLPRARKPSAISILRRAANPDSLSFCLCRSNHTSPHLHSRTNGEEAFGHTLFELTCNIAALAEKKGSSQIDPAVREAAEEEWRLCPELNLTSSAHWPGLHTLVGSEMLGSRSGSRSSKEPIAAANLTDMSKQQSKQAAAEAPRLSIESGVQRRNSAF